MREQRDSCSKHFRRAAERPVRRARLLDFGDTQLELPPVGDTWAAVEAELRAISRRDGALESVTTVAGGGCTYCDSGLYDLRFVDGRVYTVRIEIG